MFYGSTVEHRQGSMISDPYESRHVRVSITSVLKLLSRIIREARIMRDIRASFRHTILIFF